MGFYYKQQPGPEPESKPGCLDVIVITRVVFSILFWPIAALMLVIIDIGVTLVLFTVHPALALIPLGLTAVAVYLIARWDQNRDRPDGFDDLPPPRI